MNETQTSMPGEPSQSAAACLEAALLEQAQAEGEGDFLDEVRSAAQTAGCSVMFELPAMLVDSGARRAVAVAAGGEDDDFLVAVRFDSDPAIRVIHGGGLEPSLRDFTRSYAGVLGMLALDRTGDALLH